MENLIPVEFKNQRIMTTEVLAEEFGTDKKNIQMNFTNNQSRFIEGKHYYKLEGQALKDFKDSLPNNIGEPLKYAPQLILWTDRGAARHAKILDTDEAWEVYEELEENYFNPKPLCKEDIWIAQIQEMKNLRLQVQEVNKIATDAKQQIENAKEVITIRPSETWRTDTNKLLKKICYQLKDYQTPKDNIYKALQERGGCDLKRRLENMRGRLLLNGSSKSKVDNLNYLDVIAEDKKLIEIYTAIVKEMAIKNGVTQEAV